MTRMHWGSNYVPAPLSWNSSRYSFWQYSARSTGWRRFYALSHSWGMLNGRFKSHSFSNNSFLSSSF